MILVKQTLFGNKNGNCFQACLASIFELSLESVPHFMVMDEWEHPLEEWLRQFDCYYIELVLSDENSKKLRGYHLIGGKGARGIAHVVVGLNGTMVYDPHPDGSGLSAPLDDCEGFSYGLFVNRNQCPELLHDILGKKK